jgi:hypothetical protein
MAGSVGNIAGCAAVLAAVGALCFGLLAINNKVPPKRLISAAESYEIGLGVEVTPPSHTVVDFVRDGVQYRVRAIPYAVTLGGPAEALRGDGAQTVGPGLPVSTAHGVPGMEARFEESNGAGFVFAFLDRGVGVDVLVSGTDQGMITNPHEILDSVGILQFESRR